MKKERKQANELMFVKGFLVYLYEKGYKCTSDTCASAASGGSLECLKFLHEKGCGWDNKTCKSAAGGGYLECLRYDISTLMITNYNIFIYLFRYAKGEWVRMGRTYLRERGISRTSALLEVFLPCLLYPFYYPSSYLSNTLSLTSLTSAHI